MKIISAKNYILYAFKWVKIRVKRAVMSAKTTQITKRGAVLTPLPVFNEKLS